MREPAYGMHCQNSVALTELPAAQFFAAVNACGQDPHEAPVPVVPFLFSAALLGLPISFIPADRLHRAAPDVIRITIGREPAVIEPLHEVLHDIVEVDPAKAADAFQQRERQAAVVRPGSFRQIESAVAAHTRHRMAGDLPAALELHRASQRVSDNNTHSSVQPDICISCHCISPLSIEQYHLVHDCSIAWGLFHMVARKATAGRDR